MLATLGANVEALLTHRNAIFTTTLFAATALQPIASVFDYPIRTIGGSICAAYVMKIFSPAFASKGVLSYMPHALITVGMLGVCSNVRNMCMSPLKFAPPTEAVRSVEEASRFTHNSECLVTECPFTLEMPELSTARIEVALKSDGTFTDRDIAKLTDIINVHVPNLHKYHAIVFHNNVRSYVVCSVPGYTSNDPSFVTLAFNLTGLVN